jgi:hypothetical protein
MMTETVDAATLKDLSPPHNPTAHGIPSWGPCGVLHTVWDGQVKKTFPEYHRDDGSTVVVPLPTPQASHSQWIPGAKC